MSRTSSDLFDIFSSLLFAKWRAVCLSVSGAANYVDDIQHCRQQKLELRHHQAHPLHEQHPIGLVSIGD